MLEKLKNNADVIFKKQKLIVQFIIKSIYVIF